MRVTFDRHGLAVHRTPQPLRYVPVRVWTDEQAAQTTPRPAVGGSAPDPVEVIRGATVFTEAVEGYRVELLAIDSGGYLVVVNGDVVDEVGDCAASAAAAYGRYVGSIGTVPALKLLEAVNP